MHTGGLAGAPVAGVGLQPTLPGRKLLCGPGPRIGRLSVATLTFPEGQCCGGSRWTFPPRLNGCQLQQLHKGEHLAKVKCVRFRS